MQDQEFWDFDYMLKDLLFDSNLSIAKIAEQLGVEVVVVNKAIKRLGLGWLRPLNRKVSRGQATLANMVQSLMPREVIVNEHQVGERLRLDLYIPTYKMGIEYHGRQHFFYSNLFYKSPEEFEAAQARDQRKLELCKEQGIALVVFRFSDKLTEKAVYDRILEALRTTPFKEEEKVSKYKGNAYYESRKEANRAYQKKRYQELKRQRGST